MKNDGFNGMRLHTQSEARLRGIHRKDGVGLFQAVKQGFEQLPHGPQGIVIKQGSHALPQPAFAAQLGPYRLKQGATELLRLIHQERQYYERGKHYGKILLAMDG